MCRFRICVGQGTFQQLMEALIALAAPSPGETPYSCPYTGVVFATVIITVAHEGKAHGHEKVHHATADVRAPVRRALATTAGTAGTAAASSGPIATLRVVNTFQSLGTTRCMDDSAHGFRTFPCNGGDYQKWEVHVFNDGTRRFRNLVTDGCLYDGPRGFDTQDCDSSTNVSWFISRHHNVRLTFKNQATGRCIDDSDDSGFRTTSCNGGIYQDWV
ncbi:RICIN domain-containing protein [Streptomyces sp. NPDC049541]|uniref:RICIN domain-containing protein n=1 Tax=Streptomyces sp. NPDC049541 TaxID=3365594 RepID=UPI0037A1A008